MNDSHNDDNNDTPLDAFINQSLVRDGESVRATFSTVPPGGLSARLAITTATRGLFSSLGAKLALYAGAALVVGGIAYFAPPFSESPMKKVEATRPATVATPQPEGPAASSPQSVVAAPKATPHPAVAIKQAPTTVAEQKPTLDEGDGKNIPKYTDPNYQPPIK